jgi:hypothetical protein
LPVRSGRWGNFLDVIVDGQAALFSEPHILVGAGRFAGDTENGVASLQKAARHRVQVLLMDGVATDPEPTTTGLLSPLI